MNNEIETWKAVEGTPYEVSDAGNVRKLDGTPVTQWRSDLGYMLARLSKPRTVARVHRLVAAAFVPNPGNKPFVNHIDCNRAKNQASNLEWCTQKENLEHSDRLGRMQKGYWKGKRSPAALLSDAQVRNMRSLHAAGGISYEKLGALFEVSKRAVGRIINMETYTDV